MAAKFRGIIPIFVLYNTEFWKASFELLAVINRRYVVSICFAEAIFRNPHFTNGLQAGNPLKRFVIERQL